MVAFTAYVVTVAGNGGNYEIDGDTGVTVLCLLPSKLQIMQTDVAHVVTVANGAYALTV